MNSEMAGESTAQELSRKIRTLPTKLVSVENETSALDQALDKVNSSHSEVNQDDDATKKRKPSGSSPERDGKKGRQEHPKTFSDKLFNFFERNNLGNGSITMSKQQAGRQLRQYICQNSIDLTKENSPDCNECSFNLDGELKKLFLQKEEGDEKDE